MARKFRILSIDGGGLRGIVPLQVLKELEKRTGKRIFEMFDLIAGTSTGGLIACAMVVTDNGITPKYTMEQIERMYTVRGKEIFPMKRGIRKLVNNISSLKKPRYTEKGLDRVLKDYMGSKKMTDCLRPLFIVSYDLAKNEPLLFKTRKALEDSTQNPLLYDICRATSAAPTVLPPYEFMYNGEMKTCIDGGVYMNNPVIGAVTEVSRHREHPIYGMPDLAIEDICVLSLGTGQYRDDVMKSKVEGGWGRLAWAAPITDMVMQGVSQVSTYEAEEMLKIGNFLRVTMDIEDQRFADMTDSSEKTRKYLLQKAAREIMGNKPLMRQLDEFSSLLLEPSSNIVRHY